MMCEGCWKGHSIYGDVRTDAAAFAGSAGIPARLERVSAKAVKRHVSKLRDGARRLSVRWHALAGRDARAPGVGGHIPVSAAVRRPFARLLST